MKTRDILWSLALVVLATTAGWANPITLESLLNEMTDRTAVARFPEPAYTCRQASSYDQASKAADQPGWFANNDRSFFVRQETNDGREEWVLMDVEGPGAIVRFWVTAPAYKGTIRVYLDGSDEPAITARVDELVGGAALVGPPLSEERARGRDLYLPIPYAKHCKVTFDRPNFHKTKKGEDLLYYQINYRAYAPGTEVESFSMERLAAAKAKVDQLQKDLLEPTKLRMPNNSAVSENTERIEPGDSFNYMPASDSAPKPGAVYCLSVKLDAEDVTQALRSTVLVMEFDGEQTVWCPVGDFFGGGVGVNPFRGWYRVVKKDGTMLCYWVMPYEESCKIRLENLGKQPVTGTVGVWRGPWKWDDRSMHFHATWRQERNIKTANGGRAAIDWNYVVAEGQGVFVGDTLTLLNRDPAWWGEGDEKIYVDGESFPSHFGTGTEDYYGYAWCTPAFFQAPFHAQPRAEGPNNFGNVTNTRVRLLDGIPFTKSLRFDMEVWHWRKTEVDYAATTYWYGRPGATANHAPAPDEATQPVQYRTPVTIPGFTLQGMPPGQVELQNLTDHGAGKWDNDDQLWWTRAKPGDRLTLVVPVEKDGTYRIDALMTKARDYAIVQYYLDGKRLGDRIDLFDPHVVPTGPVTLGQAKLAAGPHQLAVEIVGANPEAVKQYMFGLDRVALVPVE
ncbi:MAG: DUF2961 domain-containing protein [Pirellulales bacterium]|nr:DUF2961 domain-containing protein [Pirellulales bacterium]